MKKNDFKKIALLGLSGGLFLSGALHADSSKEENTSENVDPADGNLGYHVMTEDELLLQLNPKGIAMYKALTPEGKGLALLVASMRCAGTNQCKGLNACDQEQNKCAGKGDCKGKGKCGFSDKNLAVKIVSEKMAQKRAEAGKK